MRIEAIQKMDNNPSFKRAFKYVWTLCVANMYLETILINQRDLFLGREQQNKNITSQISFVQGKEEARKPMIVKQIEN